jgi:thiol-disulfide isomerase/thioredoxin
MNKRMFVMCTILVLVFSIFSVTTGLSNNTTIESQSKSERPYDGFLKVYITEPTSRWKNADNEPYHFGFLDFALEEDLSIEYLATYNKQVSWNANDAGYSQVSQQNLMAIAAIFNPETNKRYSYPPFGNEFAAHYVDAAAAAKPGETGQNTVNEEFTHTVFCEEATATWCGYCPEAAEALGKIYDSEDYPFYFVAMIADKSDSAYDRLLDDYNLYGYPTCYFDAGYKVVVGAGSESAYRNRIETCGKRDVHELDLTLSVEWVANGEIDIDISITNNELMPNTAPDTPTLDGPNNGKPNIEQDFTLQTTDPDEDEVYYYIEWGDETNSGWLGPYQSGEEITVSNTWSEEGSFTIRAKAKDNEDKESGWTTFDITMPRARYNRINIIKIFEEIYNIFLDLLKN